MKGEVVMMTNNGSVTSIRIATSWTDDHDPVVIDIPFKTHDEAFFTSMLCQTCSSYQTQLFGQME